MVTHIRKLLHGLPSLRIRGYSINTKFIRLFSISSDFSHLA